MTGDILPGLVSITFRALSPENIVDLVSEAGLAGIEWGGDVHVPHGDVTRAREVNRLTKNAGLQVAAYGSYYRVGQSEEDGLSFTSVLETALVLEAPLIRVWAGTVGSADADNKHRKWVEDESRRIAAEAAGQGVQVAFEFHGNTLTDTTASAAALLGATHEAGMQCYWQPLPGWSCQERIDALKKMLPYLANLHVFHWHDHDRCPLADGEPDWRSYLETVPRTDNVRWALLEFVRDDNPTQFAADAKTLLRILERRSHKG
ncbi:MAG: sugar phosphate isomerase/epimerase [Candidatus Pacebacteria bacterium]|nr:sugar phosphate isomerase/epimerase [Candidatus Paceibacterota bacterium]